MFALRKVFKNGTEHNVNLGESYSLIMREQTPDEFDKIKVHTGHDDDSIYGFVIYNNGSETHPLYKTQRSYIMTGNGTTFCNLSFK